MYVGSYAICVLNWNWWLTPDHFLIRHWSQRTHRCSARVVGLEEYSAHGWRAATSGTARSSYLARVGPVHRDMFQSLIKCFAAPLRGNNDRHLSVVRLCRGLSVFCKTVEIPIGHVSADYIATDASHQHSDQPNINEWASHTKPSDSHQVCTV